MTPDTVATFDRRTDVGAYDIIGDVHGCCDELELLLQRLGYTVTWPQVGGTPITSAPPNRRIVFVGDLVDRGPRAADCIAIAMAMNAANQALCVPGNHDVKFRRWLDGRAVSISHGLDVTIADMRSISSSRRIEISRYLRQLPPYLWLDNGRLVVAHAGIKADMIGKTSHTIENFCLYGDTENGKTSQGLPIRYNWAAHYRGTPLIVYGHTCVDEPTRVNNTVCIDTGCCFGGALTALRYPEQELISIPANHTYMPRKAKFGLPPTR